MVPDIPVLHEREVWIIIHYLQNCVFEKSWRQLVKFEVRGLSSKKKKFKNNWSTNMSSILEPSIRRVITSQIIHCFNIGESNLRFEITWQNSLAVDLGHRNKSWKELAPHDGMYWKHGSYSFKEHIMLTVLLYKFYHYNLNVFVNLLNFSTFISRLEVVIFKWLNLIDMKAKLYTYFNQTTFARIHVNHLKMTY